MTEMTVPLTQLPNGRWGSPSAAWDHLIQRESSGIPDIIQQIQDINSGGNEAEGLFQITPRTWNAHGGLQFAQSARFAMPQQQAIVAARIFTANPSGGDWGAGRPGREDADQLAAGLVPADTTGGPIPVSPTTTDPRLTALAAVRPDFNEYANWSDNCQDRNNVPVDLWLNHTEEGEMNADDLVNWMKKNGVSYHYAGSQAADGGVTIVDMVDTDDASWSVMNSNDRAINFCYAGSYSSWTRQDWLDKAGKVIDVAAYLFVQDCIKYPSLRPTVIMAPYADPPGMADHNYCTAYLHDGNNHTDCGANFPVDMMKQRVAFYWQAANNVPGANDPHPNPTPAPAVTDPTTDGPFEVLAQIRGHWAMLGNQTVVETLAELRDKITGSTDAGKKGFEW